MNYQQQLANSAAIRAEIQRFESVHPNIYSIYELLERVEEPVLQNQIREHVIAIEGEPAAPSRRGEGQAAAPHPPRSPWPCLQGTGGLTGSSCLRLPGCLPFLHLPVAGFFFCGGGWGVRRGGVSWRGPHRSLCAECPGWPPGVGVLHRHKREANLLRAGLDRGTRRCGEKLFCFLPAAGVQAEQRSC